MANRRHKQANLSLITVDMLTLIIQMGSLIAAIAAMVLGVIMANVTKKFGTGILASGFKSISLGVFLIAGGIIIDALTSFLQITDLLVMVIILLFKYVFLIAGTYLIVISSKRTSDKLESLTK